MHPPGGQQSAPWLRWTRGKGASSGRKPNIVSRQNITPAAPHGRVGACSHLNMGMMTVSTFFPAPSPDVSTDTSLRVPSAASCTSCIHRPRTTSPDGQQAPKSKRQPRVKERNMCRAVSNPATPEGYCYHTRPHFIRRFAAVSNVKGAAHSRRKCSSDLLFDPSPHPHHTPTVVIIPMRHCGE